MPEQMASQITGGDTYAGVLGALAARPAAPGVPDAPGEILCWPASWGTPYRSASSCSSRSAPTSPTCCWPARPRPGPGCTRPGSSTTPRRPRPAPRSCSSADAPWVVVLDAPVGAIDPIWVNDMCDALGATALWAVVDATRKTADTARHLRTLGDVEALVVHSVDLTADPATVLGLDLPIFSLDGKPATPHALAAMLCARIAADVAPVAAAPRRVARAVRR